MHASPNISKQTVARQVLAISALLLAIVLVMRLAVAPQISGPEAAEKGDQRSEIRAENAAYFHDGVLPKALSSVRAASPPTGESLSAPRSPDNTSAPNDLPSCETRIGSAIPIVPPAQPLYCVHKSYLI